MGRISAAKLAGISLILGPVITVICYFIQTIASPSSGESWGDIAIGAKALKDLGATGTVTGIIIPLSLTMLLYGVFFILNEIRGDGEALVGYAKIPMLIGLAGWTYTSGLSIMVANWTGGEDTMMTIWGMGQFSGIMFSLGFTAAFLAIASRDGYNSVLAYIAAAIAFLAVILSIVQLLTSDGSVAATMVSIVGITYIIHTIYSIHLGRGLLSRA